MNKLPDKPNPIPYTIGKDQGSKEFFKNQGSLRIEAKNKLIEYSYTTTTVM